MFLLIVVAKDSETRHFFMFFTVKLSLVAISRTNKRKETTSLNQRAAGTSEYAAYDDAARLEL